MPSPATAQDILDAAAFGDIPMLKEIRMEIGDERTFRRMCNSVSDFVGFKVLHAAAGMARFETCKFLVEEVGVDIDVKTDESNSLFDFDISEGDTPLLIAVKGEHVDIARYLIEQGADITTTDSNGLTALHCSVLNEDTENMFLLLTKGADIEADSTSGTPLHCAAKSGSAGIVNFLLQHNAKPNSISKYLGISPLISAIYSPINTVDCVDLLLRAKADPNMFANGLSPLAHAIEAKSNSCIDSLIAAGANVDEVSSCGLRPIEHAALVDNIAAISILVLTSPRILSTPNFSLKKLLNSTAEAKERRKLYIRNLKQNGNVAWDKRDYSSAITSYSDAIHHNPNDEKLVANRSLCWARMGEGVFALHDAEACIALKPDWAKAHFRAAIAWYLLKRYRMSSNAFKRGFELVPENGEIERSARC